MFSNIICCWTVLSSHSSPFRSRLPHLLAAFVLPQVFGSSSHPLHLTPGADGWLEHWLLPALPEALAHRRRRGLWPPLGGAHDLRGRLGTAAPRGSRASVTGRRRHPPPQSRRRGVVVGRGFSGAFGSGWKWKCFSTVRVWKWRAALPLAVFFLGESCVDFVRNNGGSWLIPVSRFIQTAQRKDSCRTV